MRAEDIEAIIMGADAKIKIEHLSAEMAYFEDKIDAYISAAPDDFLSEMMKSCADNLERDGDFYLLGKIMKEMKCRGI